MDLALLEKALEDDSNYNLIETYKAVANPRKNDKEAIVGEKTIRSFTDKMVKARHY